MGRALLLCKSWPVRPCLIIIIIICCCCRYCASYHDPLCMRRTWLNVMLGGRFTKDETGFSHVAHSSLSIKKSHEEKKKIVNAALRAAPLSLFRQSLPLSTRLRSVPLHHRLLFLYQIYLDENHAANFPRPDGHFVDRSGGATHSTAVHRLAKNTSAIYPSGGH